MPLRADKAYLSPNGYRVTVAQQPHDPSTWTPDRHRPQRHVVPQAGDGLRRRQVGDLQGHHRRVHRRLGVRRRASRPTWTRSPRSSTATSPGASSTPTRNGTRPAPDPVGATARSGRSSSCSPRRARSTPPSTTPGSSRIPPVRQGARLRRQALLPPGVGRRLAQPLQRRRDRRPAGQRAAPRRRQDHPQHAARRLQRRRVVAPVQPAPRLLARGEGADPGRHHGLHRRARAACSASTRRGRTSWSRTARACSSSGPTTRSTAATTRMAERDIADPRHVPVQLRAADPRGCRRDARRGRLVHRVQPADGRT